MKFYQIYDFVKNFVENPYSKSELEILSTKDGKLFFNNVIMAQYYSSENFFILNNPLIEGNTLSVLTAIENILDSKSIRHKSTQKVVPLEVNSLDGYWEPDKTFPEKFRHLPAENVYFDILDGWCYKLPEDSCFYPIMEQCEDGICYGYTSFDPGDRNEERRYISRIILREDIDISVCGDGSVNYQYEGRCGNPLF